MNAVVIRILAIVLLVFGVSAQPPDSAASGGAVGALASYYEAINRKDYRRAYGYRQTQADSFEEFAAGYAETEKVRLIVELPARIEGAAGSLYAAIPAVLIALQRGGRRQAFAGCFVMRKSNLRPPDTLKRDGWQIYRAKLKTVSQSDDLPQRLSEACKEAVSMPDDKQAARVSGIIGLDSKQFSDARKAPERAGADRNFAAAAANEKIVRVKNSRPPT